VGLVVIGNYSPLAHTCEIMSKPMSSSLSFSQLGRVSLLKSTSTAPKTTDQQHPRQKWPRLRKKGQNCWTSGRQSSDWRKRVRSTCLFRKILPPARRTLAPLRSLGATKLPSSGLTMLKLIVRHTNTREADQPITIDHVFAGIPQGFQALQDSRPMYCTCIMSSVCRAKSCLH
jgi:hypothetical protein